MVDSIHERHPQQSADCGGAGFRLIAFLRGLDRQKVERTGLCGESRFTGEIAKGNYTEQPPKETNIVKSMR